MSSQQETPNLSNRLEKLDLETKKKAATDVPLNPFMRRRRSRSLSSIDFGPSCDCMKRNQAIKHTISFKRPHKKLLREPVLKFVQCIHGGDKHNAKTHHKHKEKLFGQCSRQKECDFKSIVNACAQLRLNNTSEELHDTYSSPNFTSIQARLNPPGSSNRPAPQTNRTESGPESSSNTNTNSRTSSCSHQARMNEVTPPCDMNIVELASYFETIVHIPKKMSSMAEMMYI